MNGENEVGRIFVVGCPRSGTTLVQSLLAAHSKIVTFTESHLFDKGFRSLGGLLFVRPQQLQGYAAKFVQENHHLSQDAQSWLLANERTRNVDEVARRIVASLDETARACGARYWVEKTPDHVFRISLIQSVAPNAKFIHVIRRADDVLPSLYSASRQWGRHNKTWLSCALHWTVAMWCSAIYGRGPAHFVVAYENILEHRQEIARAMIEWLGIDWEENILNDHPQAAHKCIAAGETWKAANLRASRPAVNGDSVRAPFFARAITCLGPYDALRRRSLCG
jgi:hypothetical protein